MAIQNLQSLAVLAPAFAGARATGLERKELFGATVDNPAGALSLPWRRLPGQHPMQSSTRPAECGRSYSPDTFGRRAGRFVGNAVVVTCRPARMQSKRA